jgi:acyl carrier protein
MDAKEIKDTVISFLVEEFEIEASIIQDDAPMQQTLDLDSLDYVDMVVIIDEHFGFKMIAEDFAAIKTFQDFYDFIVTKVNS